MYGHEKAADPEYVKSRTGYAITISNFSLL